VSDCLQKHLRIKCKFDNSTSFLCIVALFLSLYLHIFLDPLVLRGCGADVATSITPKAQSCKGRRVSFRHRIGKNLLRFDLRKQCQCCNFYTGRATKGSPREMKSLPRTFFSGFAHAADFLREKIETTDIIYIYIYIYVYMWRPKLEPRGLSSSLEA
jgi:hypothetical protein